MIVVFGATGSTGVPLVRALAAEGRPVRAAVRDPAAARARLGDVPLAVADLTRPETLDAALEGAERVYCAVGGPTGTPDLVAAESALIDACRRRGVRRYVKVSGIDAPTRRAEIQRMHAAIEDHLLASGVPWTILRPTFFQQNLLGLAGAVRAGVLPVPGGRGRCAFVDARDVAAVAHRALVDDGLLDTVLTLTGPASLDHDAVAAALARVVGRDVRYVDVPADAFAGSLVQAGLPAWFAHLLADVHATVLAPGHAARTTDAVPRITGRPAGGLDAFLDAHAAAFVG